VAATCPWCSAARAAGPTCPRCGANYAKAEQIKTQGRAVAVPVPAVLSEPVFAGAVLAGMEDRAVDDPALEFKLSVAAVPAMLAVALLFHLFLPGLLGGGLGFAAWRAYVAEKMLLVVFCGVLLVVQAIGTFYCTAGAHS
jgi:hypothetical protein